MLPAITIGIPVKNEENTIIGMLQSLVKAVGHLDKSTEYETIICLNGTTDDTEKVLKDSNYHILRQKLNLKIIHSKPGILPAERKIAITRKLHGFILFSDADIILDKYAIKELYNLMCKNDEVQVTYAEVLPKFQRMKNNFSGMLSDYYKMRHLLPERKYFHGRLFLLRDDKELLESNDFTKNMKKIPSRLVKDLYLGVGPISDDIILSAKIFHKYGERSIKRAKNAFVYFYPPDNLHDFFIGVRRRTIEIERRNLLFPEYRKIQEKHFDRESKITKPTLLRRKKHMAELLMDIEAFLEYMVKDYEIYKNKHELWEPVKSNKLTKK
jgi:glycosyltransferase involved in cell wall biosynthesis